MPTLPRHRWLQFSMGTMLLVMTLTAVFSAYHASWIRQRHAALDRNKIYNSAPGTAPGFLWIFGERGYSEIGLLPAGNQNEFSADSEQLHEIERVAKLFPEATRLYLISPDKTPIPNSSAAPVK